MTKERIREIVGETFAKTFDPVFVVRLASFMELYREDLLQRHDWFREFGYHAVVEGKPKVVFDLLPLEELVVNTIANKIYEEQKHDSN